MCIRLISLITFSIFLSFLMIACATNSAEENTPSDDSPATGIASSYSLYQFDVIMPQMVGSGGVG
jgi:hypothetical protein